MKKNNLARGEQVRMRNGSESVTKSLQYYTGYFGGISITNKCALNFMKMMYKAGKKKKKTQN